jgi:hypothetical protein
MIPWIAPMILLLAACYDDPELVDVARAEIALRDTWAAKAARIQQSALQRDVPLDRWQRIGTHNSHVGTTYTKCGDRSCYYARANQHRSISAQLEMGVRTLMLDVYDNGSGTGGGDCQWGWGVCFSHAGESFGQWSVAIEDEIAGWINAAENRDEVLFLLLEDYFDEGVGYKLQFFDELLYRFDRDYWPGAGTSPTVTTGDLIFRAVDKDWYFPDRWPTSRELVQMGKRIVISVKNRDDYDIDLQPYYGVPGNLRDWFFDSGEDPATHSYSVQYPWWDANFAPSFDGARCGSTHIRDAGGNVRPLPLSFTQFEERKICDHFELCTFLYDLPEFTRRIDVQAAVECGFSVALDQAEADPGYTGQYGYDYYSGTLPEAIWSFGEGEPNNAGNEDCAEMRSDGRWNDVSCAAARQYACKKTGVTCDPASCPADFWTLSASAGPWDQGFGACPQGYAFGVPTNGYENRKLRERASGALVWLSFADRQVEDRWEVAAYYAAWAPGEPNDHLGEDCAHARADGLWNDLSCGTSLQYECKKTGATCTQASCPADFWTRSSSAGPWSQGFGACPPGYAFGVPTNDTQNARLQAVAGGTLLWLNFADSGQEGDWRAW